MKQIFRIHPDLIDLCYASWYRVFLYAYILALIAIFISLDKLRVELDMLIHIDKPWVGSSLSAVSNKNMYRMNCELHWRIQYHCTVFQVIGSASALTKTINVIVCYLSKDT